MNEFSQFLIHFFIFFELFAALVVIGVLYFCSYKVKKYERSIKAQLEEVVESIVTLRKDIQKFNKVMDFLKNLEKFHRVKKMISGTIGILKVLTLLSPVAKGAKIRRLFSFAVLKSAFVKA